MKKYQERESRYGEGTDIVIYHDEAPQPVAELAIELIGRFGAVAAVPDGESSDGRTKLRLQTPAELVERCCAIADLAIKEFRKRDWVLALPNPKLATPRPPREPKP